MKKLLAFLLALGIIGCQSSLKKNEKETSKMAEIVSEKNIESQEPNFENHLEFPIKKLNLKSIEKSKYENLRIWKFPGGGAIFEQMLEYKKESSELTLHSYLIEKYKDKENFSHLNYSKKIENKFFTNELVSIIKNPEFILSKNVEEYCGMFLGCADFYLVEFTNGKKTIKFTINENIANCDNPKAENLKRIYNLMNKII